MSGDVDLKARTKSFALRIIKAVDALPNTRSANVIGNQLLRSGTSVGANYRAACRRVLRRNSSPNWVSSKKRPMSAAIGWNYWWTAAL